VVRKIPLNLFGTAFGTAGLGGTWLTAAAQGYAPAAVGIVLLAIAAVLWAVMVGIYGTYAIGQRRLAKDLVDPVGGPFAALALITPTLIAVPTLPHPAATVVVDVFAALIVVHGSWFTGQLIYAGMDLDQLHPGYFLPSAASGFIAAAGVATAALHWLGWERPAGQGLWTRLVLAAITGLVAAVAVHTVLGLLRGTLLPRPVMLPADAVRPTVSSVG
jgi:tellurite resistance protein